MRHIFELVQDQLDEFDIEWTTPDDGERLDAVVSPDVLVSVVTILKSMDVFYLVAMTGLDAGAEEKWMEVLYHFCARNYVVTLRVQVNKNRPELASICAIFPYASPLERETSEMFGITFLNAPDDSRLFLSDDWDERIYPLRKDAILEETDHANGG